MGDINQLTFIRRHADIFLGPYLEVGSKDYGSTQDIRALFADAGEYCTVDMHAGPKVDQVLDLTADFDDIDAALGHKRFGTIFCLSVLEHCGEPFEMARNLSRLLAPGGYICISAPFAWRIHPYPDDFWRFTPAGIRRLFSEIDFEPERCCAATCRRDEFQPLDGEFGRVRFSFSKHWRRGRRIQALSARCLRILARIGLFRWFAGYRYLFAPTNILMVGRRPDGPV